MSDVTTPGTRLPLATARDVRRAMGRYLRTQRPLVATTVVLSASAALLGLVAPWAIGLVVDAVQRGEEHREVVLPALWVAGSGVLSAVLTTVSAILVARVGQRVLARMREDVVSAVLRLPPGQVEEAGRGDLASRVGDDVAAISEVITTLLAPWIAAALTVLLTLVGLGALNPWLAVAGLTSIPVYVLSLRWYLPRAAPRYSAERAAFGDRAEALVSAVEGRATLHAYRAADRHVTAIAASSDRARSITRDVLWFATAWGKWMNIAEAVGLGAIIAAGFVLVSTDAATVGVVTAAALYFHRLFNPLGLIIYSFDQVQSAVASLQRVIGVVEAGRDLPAPQPAAAPRTGAIAARGITHRYGDREILHDVTLEVAAGEQVALVGPSGAGKSTLAAILAGLTDPTHGSVAVDGIALRDLAHTHPKPVVLAAQEVHVFAGSLADDVRLGRAGASDEDVATALALVGATAWVDALPEGLHTTVGELGHALTPEQVAQLALARAALADPIVLLLDEATAESGSTGGARLEEAATAVLTGRTGIVIAHRLRQARSADRVVVLVDGRIAEQGTHEQLLDADGVYARLWTAYDAGRGAAEAPTGSQRY